MRADQILSRAAHTYAEKAEVYGNSYHAHGVVAKALLGDVTLGTIADHNRFAVLSLIIVKLVRYCANFEEGHQDSLHDLIVYAAMLEELDREYGCV